MSMIVHAGGKFLGRQELPALATPVSASASHVIIPHHEFLDKVLESLELRNIGITKEQYALGRSGQHFFGMLTLDIAKDGRNLVMGIRNSHDKMFRASMVAGFRVFVCDNLAFSGDFMPMARKHTKNFLVGLTDGIDLGVTRIQREFTLVNRRIERWQQFSLSDAEAKLIIYRAFVSGDLDATARLAPKVHQYYFEPPHEEFQPRNVWSLHNAFTEAFKALDPVPQYSALVSLDKMIRASVPDLDLPVLDVEPEPLVEVG